MDRQEQEHLLNEIKKLKEREPSLLISGIYYIAKDFVDKEDHIGSMHDINGESNSGLSQALVYLHQLVNPKEESNVNPLAGTSAMNGLKKHEDGMYSYNV